MKLDQAQVRHVAKLARLALSDDEATQLTAQLSQVLDAVEQLSTVPTDGVPCTVFGHDLAAATRPDEVRGELGVEAALANAPQKVGTSFAIPKVLE